MHNNEYQPHSSANSSSSAANDLPCNISSLERALSAATGAILLYTSIRRFYKRPLNKLYKAGLGSYLLYRGVTGNCAVYTQLGIDGTKSTAINIRDTFTVNKPKEEVYAFWRKLENLPKFMRHLSSVKEIDDTRSHWEAKLPENNPISISWDAEIVKDDLNSFISWRSLPGSTIENAGKVEFRDALGKQGTEIRVMISYRPPAGHLGSSIAKLFNPMVDKMIREDVTNFKQYIEFTNAPASIPSMAGTARLEGAPSGKKDTKSGQSFTTNQPGGINNPNKQW